jgi:hypothetical protein
MFLRHRQGVGIRVRAEFSHLGRHDIIRYVLVFSIIVFLQGVLCVFSPSCTCIYSDLRQVLAEQGTLAQFS